MKLQSRSISSVDFRGVAVPFPFTIDELSANGNLSGDGRISTPEIGRLSAEKIVDFSAAFVAHFKTCNPREALG
jgi:creatinine amidohydrolase